ncbi:MAG: NifB/NifX family molybdenum-iron cluster-binding protein [Candidatus Aenigmatarchaeota archaeon]
MKVAISTDSGNVSAHFGRCPEFTIAEIDSGKVKEKKTIENPGHRRGYLPKFMNEQNVDCMIAGGMGNRAAAMFEDFNIRTITGVKGRVDEVIRKLAQGNLEGAENLCDPGEGKDYGVEREDLDH